MPTDGATPGFSAALARRLRGLIGIDETVLAWVPVERPRYTKLGAIVCLTATFGALSMLVVTSRVFTGPAAWLGAVAVAAFWAVFVVMIDSWLIASMHGTARRKALMYLPRLGVAVLLGVVIAEPLVILVFRPAIDQQIHDNHEAEKATISSLWRTCNPPNDLVVDRPECADHRLNLANSPSTLRDQLDDLRDQRDVEAKDLNQDVNQWKSLETAARNECAGVPGPGSTGIRGEGPQCLDNRRTADQFRLDNRLDQRRAELDALDGQLETLRTDLTAAESGYGGRVKAAIEEKISAWERSRGTTGILEELTALDQLSDRSAPVAVAHWVFRVLLVLLDCMPVLAKWMSGATAYDRRVAGEIADGEEEHSLELARRARERRTETTAAERESALVGARLDDEEIERRFERYRRELG